MTPPPIAHAGHWIADLLYVAPLVLALGFLFVQSRRDKRSDKEEAVTTPDTPPGT
jgi:hypothetical protein